MMTFKQLEAVYWVVRLGGFAPAANKLHTTQSAISKRIQELEALFDTPLFDRSLRTARLTDKGEEMFAMAQRLLAQRDLAVEQFMEPSVMERRLRLGVTELTAMTWMPKLVGQIRALHPRVVIEPDMDTGVGLKDKVLRDELDIAIVADVFEDASLTKRRVGDMSLAWMCKPGTVGPRKTLRLQELQQYGLLLQSNQSGTGLFVDQWLMAHGLKFSASARSASLLALIGMAVSGLGITYVPVDCMRWLTDANMLEIIKVTPRPPDVPYCAIYRADRPSAWVASIAKVAGECCDFTHMFQTGATPSKPPSPYSFSG